MADYSEVDGRDALLETLSGRKGGVLNLSASWAEPCVQMDDVFKALARTMPGDELCFMRINAEANPMLMAELDVAAVPTFLLLRHVDGQLSEAGRMEGADPKKLRRLVSEFADISVLDVDARIEKLVQRPIMLFMKGSPTAPRCKFSRAIVEMLREQKINYEHYDILGDPELRQALKVYSKWPTYPQLYADGQLIGGIDVIRELIAADELKKELGIESVSLEDRLKTLTTKQNIMLFMKGTPDAPRCGFSKKIVEILRSNDVKFGSFDILEDPQVRQGLKELSRWPTYPQLYSRGQLIGGVDVVEELSTSGELLSELNG